MQSSSQKQYKAINSYKNTYNIQSEIAHTVYVDIVIAAFNASTAPA